MTVEPVDQQEYADEEEIRQAERELEERGAELDEELSEAERELEEE